MSNLKIIIDNYEVKELRCKNDNCRKLICYDNVKVGVIIHSCPSCGHLSIYNMRYRELKKEFIEKLKEQIDVKEKNEG